MKIYFNTFQNKYTQSQNIKRPIYTNSNISFGMSADTKFLLKQSDNLVCAYSGKKMISPLLAKQLMAKLEKCPNIQSVINMLYPYRDMYLGDVEGKIFDLFYNKNIIDQYGQKTFSEVFKEKSFKSLENIKVRQSNILSKTDEYVAHMSESAASAIRIIEEDIKNKMKNGIFGRKYPLEMISKMQIKNSDKPYLNEIYKLWKNLPSPSNNLDAFIVAYSNSTHEQISERLINSSFATIEHVKPQSKGGADELSNYILVRAEYNNERSSMPLNSYIDLKKEINIPKNLQKYINMVIQNANQKESPFYNKAWYILEVVKTIYRETSAGILLEIKGLRVPKSNILYKTC